MLINNGQVHAWDSSERAWKPKHGNDHVIDIRDFGAACDDSTDDAAAVQAAIDYAGTTSTTRGGAQVVIPDHTAIGSTVTIDRKAILLRGLGWGRQGSSGVQPYLRWIGSAGSPMLRIKNVQGVQVRDLRFIGKSSAKPSCAISLYQVAGFGINQNVLENIALGDLLDGTSIGTGFTNGIAWEGATANNDTWMMKNIIIDGCSGYALRQNSIQNVNCFVDGLTVTNSASGLYIVGGEFHGRGWNFGSISDTILYCPLQDDAPLNAAPNIHVIGFAAEASSRLLQILGTAAVNIDAGHFQVGSFTAADGKWIKAEAGGNGGHWHIRLRNFGVPQVSSPTVTPFISVRTGTYGNFHSGILDLDDVGMPLGGPNSTGISAETRGTLEYKYIRFRPSPTYSFGGSPPNFTDFGAYQESVCIIGGVNGGGEDFQFNRKDHHGRSREQQNDACQNISSAGTAIVVDRNLLLIKNTHGSALTLTAAPTIAAGYPGERIRILNVGTDTFTLQDRGTLSGSLVDLRGVTSVTLAFLDTLDLEYFASSASGSYGSIGYWVKVGGTVAALQYQPLDSDLTTIAGLTATTDNMIQSVSSAWASRTPSQVKTALALVVGTNIQAWDADLDAIAALSPSNDDVVQRKSGAWTNRTMAQLAADLTTLAPKASPSFTGVVSSAGALEIGNAGGSTAAANKAAFSESGGNLSIMAYGPDNSTPGAFLMGCESANGSAGDFFAYLSKAGVWKIGTSGANTARGTTEGTLHLDIFNGTAPVGTLSGGISLYTTSGELRVMDSGGTATLLSQHSADAPASLYDDDDTPQRVSHEYNVFSGKVRFVNLTRAARLQQSLFMGEALPKDLNKRRTIHEETFDEYNKRLGLTPADPKYLVIADWDMDQENHYQQREKDIAEWGARRQAIARESLKRLSDGTPAVVPDDFRRPTKPEKYQKLPRPGWLKVK